MKARIHLLLATLLCCQAAGCQMNEADTATAPVPSQAAHDGGRWEDVSTLTTFEGTLPCASCAGIATILQLKPDGTYMLESTYLEAEDGEDREVAGEGRWAVTSDEAILILFGGIEGARRWAVVSVDTLRQLDRRGLPIKSDLPYELVRAEGALPIAPTMLMTGMYRYMADAAIFEDCKTMLTYPVVFEEAHIDLERAYLNAVSEGGQPLMARFDGRIESRPKMEGEGERDFVIVARFDRVFPGESCNVPQESLEGTRWNLIELNGRLLERDDEAQIPNLTLNAPGKVASGFGGCNQFTGNFRVSSDSLSFGPLASTAMACPDGMDQEVEFLGILDRVNRFVQYGGILELWIQNRLAGRLQAGEPTGSQ